MRIPRSTSRFTVIAIALTATARVFTSQGAAFAEQPSEIPFRHILIDANAPRYPECKAVGDINGDGFVDVLTASGHAQGLFWYAYPNWTKHQIARGSFTTDMQVGDMDNDGDLDVIVPLVDTGMVWYENPRALGNPCASDWIMHQIDNEGAHDVEVGDIDRDGRLDVVAREGPTRVFLQERPGVWRKLKIPTGGRGGTALGDLDGDADLDIAQNGYWLETPSHWRDSWTRHEIAAGWPGDVGAHIVDLNKDGRMDVLLAPAESRGRLVWFDAVDRDQGRWTEHVIATNVSHMHTFKTADLDLDGDLDVVTAEMEQSENRRVGIYLNQGNALTWRQQVVSRNGLHNLRVADIGNDGDIDIMGANFGHNGGATPVEMWENLLRRPSPSLTLDRWIRHVIDRSKPWSSAFLLFADLDRDGRMDIVTGAWWYRNPGSPGGFWERNTFGNPLRDAALIADFDSDGDWDLIGTRDDSESINHRLVWARNEGHGKFTVQHNITAGQQSSLAGCAPIYPPQPEGYKRMDIALSWRRSDQGVQLLSVPANPSAEMWPWTKISDQSQGDQLSAGHVDSDLKSDILLGTRWLQRDQDRWTLRVLDPTKGTPARNRLSEINGDGRMDAVVGFESVDGSGKLAWYEQPNLASGEWPEHVVASISGPHSLDVADIDRDGDTDIVVGEQTGQGSEAAKLYIFENQDGRGGQWRKHVVHTGDEHHHGSVVIDIDNDGDLDLISIGLRHSLVLLYENQAIP